MKKLMTSLASRPHQTISTLSFGDSMHERDHSCLGKLEGFPNFEDQEAEEVLAQAPEEPRKVRWKEKLRLKSAQTQQRYKKHIIDFQRVMGKASGFV